MDSGMVLVRRSAPTELDIAPYGTKCKVMDHHHDEYDMYLQVGYNEDEPHWELLGVFTSHTNPEYLANLSEARLRKHGLSD